MDSEDPQVVVDNAAQIYKPLYVGREVHDQEREIRILTLSPTPNREAQIECTLKKIALKERTPYTALSYTWGDAANTREILVNGYSFETTINLHNALKQFRDAKDSISLWVDAICINQKNSAERSSQVQLMQQIFSHADRTWLWLGEEADGSAKAIDLVERLSTIYLKSCKSWDKSPEFADQNLWGRLEDNSTAEEVVALDDLLARNYWYRIWVVQEIAVSSEILIYCGERKFSWDALLFTSYLLDRQVHYRGLIQTHRPRSIFARGVQSGIQRIMSIQSVRNDCQGANVDGKRDSLLFLLSNHRSTEATEPKDKYIALAGLARTEYSIPQYYNKSVSVRSIYTLAAYHLSYESVSIPNIKPLDFLDCAGGHWSAGYWPSWVPDWRIPTGRATPLLYWQLAAKFEEGITPLNAAGFPSRSQSESTIAFGQASGKELLKAEGFMFDTILDVAPGSHARSQNQDPKSYGKRDLSPSTTEDDSDILWKTCTLDRSHAGGQKAPLHWGSIFYQHLLQPDPSNVLGILNTWYNQNKNFEIHGRMLEHVVQEKQASIEKTPYPDATLMQFKTAFVNAVGYRKLATTSKGHLCLVPQTAEVGDSIAILYDCNVPVVLRARGMGYHFLGTCYVHGIMYGEGVAGLDHQEFIVE